MKKYTVKICDKEVEINKTRTAAIKAFCVDCSAGQVLEVKHCPCKMCPLYIYRGRGEGQYKKILSEAEKAHLMSIRPKKKDSL